MAEGIREFGPLFIDVIASIAATVVVVVGFIQRKQAKEKNAPLTKTIIFMIVWGMLMMTYFDIKIGLWIAG